MQIEKDIAKLQAKLIKEVKENGIYENFGEKEQRKIADKYDFYKDKNAYRHYMNFVDWCQNYNG
jgi:ribosomal protein S21